MRFRTLCLAVPFIAALCACATPAAAVTIGQLDTFSDLTTQGWLSGPGGNPVPPSVVATGGPGGAGDPYLLIQAIGGNGPGSRLAAINAVQWTGNYISPDIGLVMMQLSNFGTTDLSVRLFLADLPNHQVVTQPVVIPAGSGWVTAHFLTTPASVSVIIGDAASALSNVTEMRIQHMVTASPPPPVVVGQLGVDNIIALSSPLPVHGMTWGRIKTLYAGPR